MMFEQTLEEQKFDEMRQTIKLINDRIEAAALTIARMESALESITRCESKGQAKRIAYQGLGKSEPDNVT